MSNIITAVGEAGELAFWDLSAAVRPQGPNPEGGSGLKRPVGEGSAATRQHAAGKKTKPPPKSNRGPGHGMAVEVIAAGDETRAKIELDAKDTHKKRKLSTDSSSSKTAQGATLSRSTDQPPSGGPREVSNAERLAGLTADEQSLFSDILGAIERVRADRGDSKKHSDPLHQLPESQQRAFGTLISKIFEDDWNSPAKSNGVEARGTEVRKPKGKKLSRLHQAAIDGDAIEVASLLADGHCPNDRDPGGYAPLHDAASPEIARLLLEAGADASAVFVDTGNTALHEAALYNNFETIKVLVSYGADVNFHNRRGQTPR